MGQRLEAIYFQCDLPDRCSTMGTQWFVLGETIALAACCSLACGSSRDDDPGGDVASPVEQITSSVDPAGNSPVTTSGGAVTSESGPSTVDFGVSDAPTNEIEVVCAAQSAASELRHVSLGFLFDVSASMGGNDRTRFETKWLPVVAATEGFFAEGEAAALTASLTFFPTADEDARCNGAAYVTPNVPETALPSPLFGDAIRGLNYTLGSSNWRSSTPTLPAYTGLVTALTSAPTDSLQAIVLVTDGVPQGCNGADDIQLVADAVRSSGIKTFVVGVANPPGDNAGDNLANLNVIAQAGGTDQAFIVATGDPAQTEADFKAVIDGIRGVALACDIAIPLPPSGSAFVPERVNVVYGSASSAERTLDYDPSCATEDAWHYDDAMMPTTIVLCNESCGLAQREASAHLSIEFGCERRGNPR
jgi:hypothetical protein